MTMKKLDFRTLVMLLCVASMTVFFSCDNKGNEPDDPQGGQTDQSGGEETPAPDPYNGHAYVDLGLSVKWATCNVGATKPEEYGNYYAWGETTTKSEYTPENYTYAENSEVLPLDRDAAAVNMGGDWRMPTSEEQQELIDECTWTWTTLNDVRGYNVEGPNGNAIFLPAAGYRYDSDLNYAGSYGYYWSSSLDTGNSDDAYYLYFYSDYVDWDLSSRYCGLSVRGVIR